MDRSDFKSDHEPSIVCLLDSMKNILSKTKSWYFMGANRQNIDVSFPIFSAVSEYAILYKFINEMLIVPINSGVFYLLIINCLL